MTTGEKFDHFHNFFAGYLGGADSVVWNWDICDQTSRADSPPGADGPGYNDAQPIPVRGDSNMSVSMALAVPGDQGYHLRSYISRVVGWGLR